MAYCYVIMYSMYQEDYSHDQVALVHSTLDQAIEWLHNGMAGEKWARLAHIDGTGIRTRLITNFGQHNWTEYRIEKHILGD
jgi:hypothetical protein